jgi:hypothetical protein
MTDPGKIKRRQLLKGAGALSALGALAALGSPTAAFAKNTNAGQGPEGSWLYTVTVTSSSGPPSTVLGLETYAAGGGYVETDQFSFMHSSLATPGHGSWKSTGERTFLLTYLTLSYDTQGTRPNAEIRVKIGHRENEQKQEKRCFCVMQTTLLHLRSVPRARQGTPFLEWGEEPPVAI